MAVDSFHLSLLSRSHLATAAPSHLRIIVATRKTREAKYLRQNAKVCNSLHGERCVLSLSFLAWSSSLAISIEHEFNCPCKALREVSNNSLCVLRELSSLLCKRDLASEVDSYNTWPPCQRLTNSSHKPSLSLYHPPVRSPPSPHLSTFLFAVPMSQSPWTYSAPMELPLTRSLNSSSSESSIDSGFESPLSKSESVVSPISVVPGSFQDAISTSCAVTNMLVSTTTVCI